MLTALSPDLRDDANWLEGDWGIPVAMEMLSEHLITPMDFFELCEESVEAIDVDPVVDVRSPAIKPSRPQTAPA